MAVEQIDLAWAYIAGILDGEGSITLALQCGYHRRVRVTVPQSGSDGYSLLQSLQADSGLGRVSPHPTRKHRRLPAYRWTVDRQVECLMLLKKVRPFLRLKLHAAEVAIALLHEKAEIRRNYSKLDGDCWNRQKRWESHELALLYEKYDTKPETLDELCHLLRRTRKGIHQKAWKLGLTSPRGNHPHKHSGDLHFSLIRGGHKLQPALESTLRRN